jgi:hypothetical protein
MKTPLERFKSAVNVLPLKEECFVPLNQLIEQVSLHDPILPILSYSSNASLVQVALTGSPNVIVAPMAHYFVSCGVLQNERTNIEKIARNLNLQTIGFFLRQEGNASSIGWTITKPHSWDSIAGYLPPGTFRNTLQNWAKEKRIARVQQYSRIVGPGSPWDEVTLSIPDIDTALSLYEQLKMVLPPEPLLEEIAQANPNALGLSIWISPQTGLIRLAIRILNPTVRLSLAAQLDLASLPDSTLALVEGLLEVTAPSWVEIGLAASGRDALIAYQG